MSDQDVATSIRRHDLLLRERRHEPIESAVYLKCIPYGEYRQSRWWKFRREAFAVGCTKCSCCGIRVAAESPTNPLALPKFHTHHLTYLNLGREPDEDIAYVCSPCHNLIHYPDSNAALEWLLRNRPELLEISRAMRPE